MKFDDVISYIGQFGPYQKRYYLLLCLPAISIGVQIMSSIFTMAIPDHRCALPSVRNDTFYVQDDAHADAINVTIPYDDSKKSLSACKAYDLRIRNSSLSINGDSNKDPSGEISCNRWVYDKSVFETTLVSELDLVCEGKLGRSHAQMFLMLGCLFGALVLGPPADFFGRRIVMYVGILLHIGATWALAFTFNFAYLCAFFFINGAAGTSLYTSCFILGMELVGPKRRTCAGIFIVTFFGIGVVILTGLAYFIRDWQTLQLVTACIPVIFIGYYWIIPESPRWLISKGRYEEAEVILRRAAKVNKREIPDKVLRWDNVNEQLEAHEPIWRVLTYPRLVVRTLIIYLNWLVCSMTYYGLGLNVANLAGSIYLNAFLYGCVEIIAYLLCVAIMDRTGRKRLHLALMFMAGVACTASPFPVLYGGQDLQWMTVVLAVVGKFGVSGAFATIWLYSSELFPTVVRSSGLSTSSFCARVGGVISPYVANLTVVVGGDLGQILPLLIFGGLSLLAGLLTLFLPETKNSRLPETIKDANEFTGKALQVAVNVTELETFDINGDENLKC